VSQFPTFSQVGKSRSLNHLNRKGTAQVTMYSLVSCGMLTRAFAQNHSGVLKAAALLSGNKVSRSVLFSDDERCSSV
jgi:hypothetical protein